MYKSFSAENFRCFEDLTVAPLQRINLITGKNNVGKTALLEAIWLHHGYHNPELGLRLRVFRGLPHFKRDEFLWDLFSEFAPEKTIRLSSEDHKDQKHMLRITVHEHSTSRVSLRKERSAEGNGQESLPADMLEKETTTPIETEIRFHYTGDIEAHAYVESDGIRFERPPNTQESSAVFLVARRRDNLETLAERFGDLQIERKASEVVKILRIIEPRLEDLIIRYAGGRPIIYGDIGTERLIPLPLMGDGMGRLLDIVLAIAQARDGVLLVDEVENGLHYSVMKDIWKAVGEFARDYSVQIFATTHSEECIYAAYQAFTGDEQHSFALHRLERIRGSIKVITYDKEMLEAAFEINAEVR